MEGSLRWVGATVLVLGLVVVWASAAGAQADRPRQEEPEAALPGGGDCADLLDDEGVSPASENPDEPITCEVRCLKEVDALLPSAEGVDGTMATVFSEGTGVAAARRLLWGLQWMGLDIPGVDIPDLARLHETVHVQGPRWYADQANDEAAEQRNCALARHVPTGECAAWRASRPARYTPYRNRDLT